MLVTPHQGGPTDSPALSLGLVIDGWQVFWATCTLTAVFPPDGLPPVTTEAATSTVRRLVAPALTGKPLIAVLDLITVISQLTETVVFTKHLAPQPAESTAVSRRSLFTGQFLNPPSPQKVTIEQEQPLHPALRDAITYLLLKAAAAQRRLTITELLAQFYAPGRPFSSIPLHLDLTSSSTAWPAITQQITSLGYTTTGTEPKAALGANGEKMQSRVRALSEWLHANRYANHALHLRLGGAYGTLYENNLGRILGAIYGLAQAARPYPLRLEDPFILPSRDAQIERLRQLQDYLRIRRLEVALAAHAWVDSITAVEAFAGAGVVQMLHLDAAHFVSLPAALETAVAAQRCGVPVMWGMNGRVPLLTAHVALALQPDLVLASSNAAAQLQNEMQRTLTWLAHKQGRH